MRENKRGSIPKSTLEKLLEAARLTPSAKNLQPWHFIVVTNPDKRHILSKGVFAKFFKNTRAVIALCGNEKASPDWYIVDVALAGENMVIAATAEGLDTCWVGSFDEAEVKQLLGVPENLRVVALLAVRNGNNKIDLKTKINNFIRPRKKLDEVASWERYGNKFGFSKGASNAASS